ncbi:MAG: DNA polymerase I [Holosporales bacterium]
MSALKHLYLVDGSGFIFRAFHALPPLTRGDGTPVGAVLGFVNMLMKLLNETDVDHMAVIFDAARRTFRHDLYPDYKANRAETPPELIPQFALVREACEVFGVPQADHENYEADDLIATYVRLAREQGAHVTIVSSDKDLMQLIGPGVEMFDGLKNRVIGPDEVREKFGVGPERVRDVLALAGDSSDNVPGVPSIGPKTAAELLAQFGDLETLLGRLDEIPQPKRREKLQQNIENARISYELVGLDDHVPVRLPLDDMALRRPDGDRLHQFLEHQGFRSVMARLQKQGSLRSNGTATPLTIAPSRAAPVETQYSLVQDEATLASWIQRASDAGVVAFDTETDSLNALAARLIGFSLSLKPGEACYVPLQHGSAQGALDFAQGHPQQVSLEVALRHLGPLLADPSVMKVGHNMKYDAHIMANYGLTISPYEDTMVMSYDLDGTRHGHGMDELADRHLGHTTITYQQVVGTGRQQITFDQVPLEQARDYAAEDADVTLRLYETLRPRLLQEGAVTLYETIDRPLVNVLLQMERAGVLVDTKALQDLSHDLEARMSVLATEIEALAGVSFNVGSPKQLGEVLFEHLKLPGGRKSAKTGAYQTSADVLEQLAEEGHELPQRVLDWRSLQKLKSTYTDALVASINPRTGRVHTSFQQTVTNTGRLSSTDPNLQNIPVRTEEGRKIRAAFIAAPGHVLLSLDYSQIELRLLASFADTPTLQEAFHKGLDIHAATAAEVFGVPVHEVDSALRRRAKAINFGIIYGISAFGLARQLKIPQSEAAAYIQTYNQRYPGIIAYMKAQKEIARRQGYVETLLGRRCSIQGINERNHAVRSFAERQAINAPLQGSAADIIKKAMVQLPPAMNRLGLSGRMVLQVHDELIFEVPQAEVEKTLVLARDIMSRVVDLKVPLVVDAGFGQSWNQAH